MLISLHAAAEAQIQNTNKSIYVQATEGSFNHQAITRLFAERPDHGYTFKFTGSVLNTFMKAELTGSQAFVAIQNSLLPGGMVQATLEAIQNYRVDRVVAGIYLPIRLCLLRSRAAIENTIPMTRITSHPAALQQITVWKQGKELQEIEQPLGTAYAAKQVAEGQLSSEIGAIGACKLPELYPGLILTEKNIQDSDNNQTLFALLEISKREEKIHTQNAWRDMQKVVCAASARAL